MPVRSFARPHPDSANFSQFAGVGCAAIAHLHDGIVVSLPEKGDHAGN
jgi:hypothetical protein